MADTAERMSMKINSEDFRVRLVANLKLRTWPTKVKPFYKSKRRYEKVLEETLRKLVLCV